MLLSCIENFQKFSKQTCTCPPCSMKHTFMSAFSEIAFSFIFGSVWEFSFRNWKSFIASKNYPPYITRKFVIFTRSRHCTLFWASWIQLTLSNISSLRFVLMLYSGAPLGLYVSCFVKVFWRNFCSLGISYVFNVCYIYRLSHSWHEHPDDNISHYEIPFTSRLLDPNILLSILCLNSISDLQ